MAVPRTSLPLQTLPGVPARIRALARAAPTWTGRGRIPASEIDPRTALLLPEHGVVVVSTILPSGRVVALSLLGSGDVWGGEDPPRDPPPSLRVDALCPSSIAMIDRDALDAALAADADAGRWLAAGHLRRALAAERRIAGAFAQSVDERLRNVLTELGHAKGARLADGRLRLGLRVSQERLAWLAGTTRESANRAMRSLIASGAVERTAGRYVLAPGFSPGEGPS